MRRALAAILLTAGVAGCRPAPTANAPTPPKPTTLPAVTTTAATTTPTTRRAGWPAADPILDRKSGTGGAPDPRDQPPTGTGGTTGAVPDPVDLERRAK